MLRRLNLYLFYALKNPILRFNKLLRFPPSPKRTDTMMSGTIIQVLLLRGPSFSENDSRGNMMKEVIKYGCLDAFVPRWGWGWVGARRAIGVKRNFHLIYFRLVWRSRLTCSSILPRSAIPEPLSPDRPTKPDILRRIERGLLRHRATGWLVLAGPGAHSVGSGLGRVD